ncbi:MAG: phage tail protein [Alphaproteobacteria bacterium]|nr:MAG: phage tail protein [Alphaproteobacteria bacterium]
MSDQFLAEIRIFPFFFAPTGWAFCDGQLMPISQNTALFALLGTVYGGDGKSTFALPDLQGSAPMQPGQGQGLSLRDLGEMSGVESVSLTQSEIPVHTHNMNAVQSAATVADPNGALLAQGGWLFQGNVGPMAQYTPATAKQVQMAPTAIAPAGGGLPHNNMQPYLTLNFCIALQGIFPQRP